MIGETSPDWEIYATEAQSESIEFAEKLESATQ
jgi:hypothetical protein